MRFARFRVFFLFLPFSLSLACASTGGDLVDAALGSDSTIDSGSVGDELGVDLAAELGVDANADIAIDAGESDLTLDGPPVDQYVVDAPPLPLHTIYFAHGSSTTSMFVAQIDSDGTNYQLVPGMTTMRLSDSTYLVGQVEEYYPVSRDIPQEMKGVSSYKPIYLPRGLGYLKFYRDTVNSKLGLLLFRGNGPPEILYSGNGTSTTNDLRTYFAVSPDGDLVAGTRKATRIVMMRTNGSKFSNGQSSTVIDWGTTTEPDYLYYNSLTFAGDQLYFVTRGSTTSSTHTLWKVAVDGNTSPTAVTLPNVGGIAPVWIDDEISVSEDGLSVVVLAGAYTSSSSSKSEDVLMIKADGSTLNLSQRTSDYRARGTTWGYNTTSSQAVTISPTGGNVAYVDYVSSGNEHLYLAGVDGAAPIELTGSTYMASASKTYLRSVRFMDDRNLLFFAGSSTTKMDLYRYDVVAKTMSNITGYGSTTQPFNLIGAMNPKGMWRSPNRKYLYMVEDSGTSGNYTADIVAIDLNNWVTKKVTQGAEFYMSSDSMAACEKGSRLYFAAEPVATSKQNMELFSFDMDTAAPAIQLTALAGTGTHYVRDITVAASCDYISFRAGSSPYHAFAGLGTSPAALSQYTQGTSTKFTVDDRMLIASDDSMVVFLAGDSSTSRELKVAPLKNPGAAKSIYDNSTGVGKYFFLFGVD
jgi:hypothetical protein